MKKFLALILVALMPVSYTHLTLPTEERRIPSRTIISKRHCLIIRIR